MGVVHDQRNDHLVVHLVRLVQHDPHLVLVAVDREELQADLGSLGAAVVSYHYSMRFISQQAVFCARKEA